MIEENDLLEPKKVYLESLRDSHYKNCVEYFDKLTKENLVKKLSQAIKMKYKTNLRSVVYSDKTLNDDIQTLLKTKYKNLPPKEVFNNIENDILAKIKASKSKSTKKLNAPKKTTPKPAKSQNKIETNQQQEKTVVENAPATQKLNAANPVTKNEETKESAPKNEQMYQEPHALSDALKLRIENDYEYKYIIEQAKKYKEQQEKEMEKKKERQQEFAKTLQQQMDERELNQHKEREAELKYGEELRQEVKRKEQREKDEEIEKRKLRELNKRYNLDQIEQQIEKEKKVRQSAVDPNCHCGYIFTGDPTETQKARNEVKKKQKFFKDLEEFQAERDKKRLEKYLTVFSKSKKIFYLVKKVLNNRKFFNSRKLIF